MLDAGCGSGRVTQLLLERLPHGRVIAVDASSSMVARARVELEGSGTDVREADLAQLRLNDGEQVDAVFSNATFHWIADHEALFASLAAALRPGGRLSVQCGGEGNVQAVHDGALLAAADAGLSAALEGWPVPWNFAGPDETEARLRAAGFEDVSCWLQPWPVTPDEPRAYLETVCLGPHLERLAPDTSASSTPSWRVSESARARLRAAEHRRAARVARLRGLR